MKELSAVERWQQEENDRLEYENYCNKIRKGLEDLDEKSGERALWELVQNARDMSEESRIKIELTKHSVIFSHHGQPFDYTSFSALVKQNSSKDRNGTDQVGQYGTGFMTTHAFNRTVTISAPFTVKSDNNKIEGYVQVNDFKLDRTLVDKEEGPSKMRDQLNAVSQFFKTYELLKEPADDTTSFCYDLTDEQIGEVSAQISNAIRLMPFVLAINTRIKEIEICNLHTNEHFTLKRMGSDETSNKNGWKVVTENILLTNHKANTAPKSYACKSLQSDKGDVVIIPPFPERCGNVCEIPSLFLWFPLLGTEAFGVNFIFHSKRFHPVEKRNNIMLPGSTFMKRDKGSVNSKVLREITEALFDYYAKDENAKSLSPKMCEVSFPQSCDDEETQNFYEEMQSLWNTRIPNWKMLPIGDNYYAVSDPNVRLLHRDFFSKLNPEQRVQYETTLINYALLPKKTDGVSYLMPDNDIIVWSEIVDRWNCNRDNEFFISVEDVCKAIQSKREDLHAFLMLMKDSGNAEVMENYPLLPNRTGDLKKKNELYDASFMDSTVYDLVKVVMGDDSKKIYDRSFHDVCKVNPYVQTDLQRAIASTMSSWRTIALNNNEKKTLTDEQLSALITFCSASCMPELNNARGRMMPLIAEFHEKEFHVVNTIRFKDENEEDFYNAAFNLLLDYTLYILHLKKVEWVKTNKEWMKSFLTEYSPSTNVEHKKRLDDYGVLPNQKGELCLMKELRMNNGVPPEMATIYQDIFDKDLHEKWIDEDFKDILELTKDVPKDIATEIEGRLVTDMKQESKDRKFEKIVRSIILKIATSKDWEEWFGQINDKKATYTFSMKSGKTQKSLFSLMDIKDEDLDRLAKLSETGNIEYILDKMERQLELEHENEVRFSHLHAIGKHIEDILRDKIESGLVKVKIPTRTEGHAVAEDVQNGQDIIVKIKDGEEWVDVYYIEVKSKWDFTEPAHMSTHQIKMAALHPEKYALCCVDLRGHKTKDLENLPPETIIECTRVKMAIGKTLNPMVKAILEADEQPDDVQIKISEYRSNMGAKVFEDGEPFKDLLNEIENIVKRKINQM